MRLTRKIGSRQTNLARGHPVNLSLNLLAQEACGLLQCYLVQKEANKNKYSCKGVSKNHNDLHFQRYKDVLDVFLKARRDSEIEGKAIDKAKNVGLKVYDQGIVTYEQNKVGLSAYYDKRYVFADGIHTNPLDFITIHQRGF